MVTTTIQFENTTVEVEVTVEGVRTALNSVDAAKVPDAVIKQKINEEILIVKAELPDKISGLNVDESDAADAIAMLIRRRAARHAWHSSPTEVRQQALDAARSFDAQAFRGQLNDGVQEAYAILGLDKEGTSAAFVDKTTSQFDPEHPQSR